MAFLNTISYRAMRERIGAPSLAEVWASRPSLLVSLCGITLIASILLGGGTRSGFLSDTILQLIAIPAFLTALSSLTALQWSGGNRAAEWGVMLCLGAVILPLVQLVPLPPSIWTRLPHRDQISGVFDMLRQPLPWLPISVVPSQTWAALVSLLPPLAIFLGVIQFDYRQRRLISLVIIIMGILSAFLGLLQVAQGTSSPWRFFAVTNASEAVGFFANRNHLAALLYSVLMFGAAWAVNVGYSSGSSARRFETFSVVTLVGSFLGLVVLIAAEGSTRSRAGLGLMIVALFGALWLAMSDRRRSSTSTPVKLIVGSAIVAILLIVQFALVRIVARFEDPLQGARIPIAENTIAAAEAYMPFGSGFGTFTTVYPGFEPTKDALDNKFVNHAHDDWLEMLLEGGAMSLMMMGGFVVWFFLLTANLWRRPPEDARGLDLLLARAATLIIPMILIHSVVDYPLRTGGMMAVFALACGFLVRPVEFQPKEIITRLAPALEISEAEKRRLARLRGVPLPVAAAPAAALEEADAQVVADAQPVSEFVEADDDIELLAGGAEPDEPPVDLDELAGLVEAALDSNTGKPASEQKVAPNTRDYPIPEPAPHPSAVEQMPAIVTAPAKTSKSMSELAQTLTQFNEQSNVLVSRNDGMLREGGDISASQGVAEDAAPTAAEAAERRLRILHSIKLVEVPGKPAAVELSGSQVRGPAQSGDVNARPASGAPPAADAAERRKQVLRSVERFMQDAGLEAPPSGAEGDPHSAAQAPDDPTGLQTGEASGTEPQASYASPNETESEDSAADQKLLATPSEAAESGTANIVDAEVSDSSTVGPDAAVSPAGQSGGEVNDDAPTLPTEDGFEEPAQSLEVHEDTAVTITPAASTVPDPVERKWSNEIEWPQQWRTDSPAGGVATEQVSNKQTAVDTAVDLEAENDDAMNDPPEPIVPAQRVTRQKLPQVPALKQKPTAIAKLPAHSRGAAGLAETPAVPDSSRWGDDIEWPDEWKK